MTLASRFVKEVRKYAEVGIAFEDTTAIVHLDSTDITKIQQVCIICDRYAIADDADLIERPEQ